ncbi:MAG: DUF697 domain-containing protein [bacterium]|nr:DUF697 domain-containing protein [bacterium]
MTTAQTATVEDAPMATEELTREEQAQQIVKRNMYWAMGIGLVPAPAVDVIGVLAFQVKSIKELSDLYEIPFSEHKVKNILASLISGLGASSVAGLLAGSMMKLVPAFGPLASALAMPVSAGALTYAIGQVFIQHFECGGTLLDFNAKKIRAYFQEQFKEGVSAAKEMKSDSASSSSSSSSSASAKK